MRISDWSSDVCSSDLVRPERSRGTFPRVSRLGSTRTGPTILPQGLLDSGFDLADPERLARHLVERPRIHQILVAQHRFELYGVHFRHDHLFIALQQRAKVLWQRPDMADVDMADVAALRPLAAHRWKDRPEGRSPAHDRQPAPGCSKAKDRKSTRLNSSH